MTKMLVVDDEQAICWGLERLGKSIGYDVQAASTAEQALHSIEQEAPDIIVLDVRLPGMDGLSALAEIRKSLKETPVVMITAYGDLETAVQAVRKGASEYIVKPFKLEQMKETLKRLETVPVVSEPPTEVAPTGELVGKAPAMQEVFRLIALAASSNVSVMMRGESGTGKELATRAIHQYSSRSSGPFVAVNVASLSPTLAESELFGHVQGSFTGAQSTRVGLLEQANGGTLFLDEVADIPLSVQTKLLRALDHGEIMPVGSNKMVKTDFRVISATHQPLEKLVQENQFRHDLYFRLCGLQIDMPALRERRGDIPELAVQFMKNVSGHSDLVISEELVAELQNRPWYGNVRELRNAIEHAALFTSHGAILPQHLPPPVSPQLVGSSVETGFGESEMTRLLQSWFKIKDSAQTSEGELHKELMQLVEPPVLKAALETCQNQYAAAARKLGLHRTTLKKKMEQYGLEE